MVEIELLNKFALDNTVNWGTLSDNDFASLVEFAGIHKLQTYMWHSLLKNNELTLNPRIIETVHDEYMSVRKRAFAQINALAELSKNADPGSKFVIIKGLTLALQRNSSRFIRKSGDVDIFSDDPEKLKDLFISQNYTLSEATCAEHEYAAYYKGEAYFELHGYFPILSLPVIDEHKYTNKRLQLNLRPITINKLEFDFLLSYSKSANMDVLRNIRVAVPELAVIITSAHIFKDLFWEPYLSPNVRAIELLEICNFMEEESFDFALFGTLIKELHANDTVAYTLSIIDSLWNKQLIVKAGLQRPQYIRKVANALFAPYLVCDGDFAELPFLSFEQRVSSLGCCEIMPYIEYSSDKINSTYTASKSTFYKPFKFCLSFNAEFITVAFSYQNTINAGSNFFVHIGSAFVHFWIDQYPSQTRCYGRGHAVTDEANNIVNIRLPMSGVQTDKIYAIIASGEEGIENVYTNVIPACIRLSK